MSAFNLIRKSKWPLYTAVIALLIPILILGHHLLQDTGGAYALPSDEAFLQLSTAKTLAFQQIWGIGRNEFAAASPSLLYPLALAVVFFIFGVHLLIIPIVNTALAIVLLASIQNWLAKKAIASVTQLFVLLVVIILTPLPFIVIYGMERCLLLLLAFLFVSRLSDEWASAIFTRRTLIYGALMVATRYDGIVLVTGISLLLIYRRKWLEAFELALWCLLPILAFGVLAMFKGSYFLPNIFVVAPADSWLSYDWLIGCGAAVVVPLLTRWNVKYSDPRTKWSAAFAIVIAIFLLGRNLYAFEQADKSSLEVHQLAYPAGQFAHRYYYRYSILSDDIGVISYLTDGRYLDLSGIASPKIARSKADNFFNAGLVRRLSKEQNSRLAIVSDEYDQLLPQEWIRVASWETLKKKSLSFYVQDSMAAARLTTRMKEYTIFLPRDLNIRYFNYERP